MVPYGIDVVFTDIDYTYDIMERDIQGLRQDTPFWKLEQQVTVFSGETFII